MIPFFFYVKDLSRTIRLIVENTAKIIEIDASVHHVSTVWIAQELWNQLNKARYKKSINTARVNKKKPNRNTTTSETDGYW